MTKLAGETLQSFRMYLNLHDLVDFGVPGALEGVPKNYLLEASVEGQFPSIPSPKVLTIGSVLRHKYADLNPALLSQTSARGLIHDVIRLEQYELRRING